jgi:RNA polymerase sigma factor (TIGR02999 family)
VDAARPDLAGEVTQLLHEAQGGDRAAFDRLLALVYGELHRLARLVRRGRATDTLDTAALVHEAYLKLAPSAEAAIHDRVHFFRVAARAMRQVLVSEARRRLADKRGGGAAEVTFDDGVFAARLDHPEELIALEEALAQLEALDERQARVVECRFFAGMTAEETARALGVSEPTVHRDWRAARAWLAARLRAP